MNILESLNRIIILLDIPVETGVFSGIAPEEYVVITPLADDFVFHSDNLPEYETQEARLSLYTKGNYLVMKDKVVRALLATGITITSRLYITHEDDTGYHHYAIDVAKIYPLEV